MYTRLCFGIASSLGVFQQIIDQLIQGITKTVAYLDILIAGLTVDEHNIDLRALHKLLQKGIPWKWGPDKAFAFEQSKRFLMSTYILLHYNAELKLIMTVDASLVGDGAVFSHVIIGKSEKLIYFASRTLLRAELNYAQIKQQRLAVIFGVFKFHEYIHSQEFTLLTDLKPLLGLFK